MCLSAAVFGGTRGMIGGTNTFATVTTTVRVAKHTDNLAARFALGLAVGEQWNHFSYLHGGSEIARVEVPGWLACQFSWSLGRRFSRTSSHPGSAVN